MSVLLSKQKEYQFDQFLKWGTQGLGFFENRFIRNDLRLEKQWNYQTLSTET